MLAISLDALVSANISLDIAAAKVARTKGIQRLLVASAKAASSIKNWRVRLKEGSAGDAEAVERWRMWQRRMLDAPTDALQRQQWFRDYAELAQNRAEQEIDRIVVS